MELDTKHIHIKDYDYPLPDARIAKYPLPERDSSKLLVYKKDTKEISEDVFSAISHYIPADSLMVFNNTKVIYARLHFIKETGAQIEVFCLEPFAPADYQLSFSATKQVTWTCMIGNLKRWRTESLEKKIHINGKEIILKAIKGEREGTGVKVTFDWNDESIAFSEILDAAGELPIPPYLNRATEKNDLNTYQTVYSKIKGSVAAPTAGLHFTKKVLSQLDENRVDREEITLHVGAGTFKPVKSKEIIDHEMHSEWIAVRKTSIEKLLKHKGKCIAVGTTSVRTLESLYYIGVLLEQCPDASENDLKVSQWLPYEYKEKMRGRELSVIKALENILEYLERNKLEVLHTSTQIIIAPGYDFHIVKTMITNFHQPESTLILLVSAFVEGNWRKIYDYALSHDFRFLSYGDSSILNV